MPETNKKVNLAKSKDFKLIKKIELKPVGYNNEYLYILRKLINYI